MSPQVGELDDAALDRALREDASAALEMLADMTVATDERLRAAARRLAGKILLDRARVGPSRARGTSRLRDVPADRGGDLDIDRSIESISTARAEGRPPVLDELVARDWGRPDLAVCLLVDASGSMSGARLAAAALTAAACAWRAPKEFAVLSFAREVQVHRALTATLTPGALVERLLGLRGHGVTALAGALRAAGEQLAAGASPPADHGAAQRLPGHRRRGSGPAGVGPRRAARPRARRRLRRGGSVRGSRGCPLGADGRSRRRAGGAVPPARRRALSRAGCGHVRHRRAGLPMAGDGRPVAGRADRGDPWLQLASTRPRRSPGPTAPQSVR